MSRGDEIRELTRVRVLSFIREPEAIFWVFIFPVVLAAVLGFAFRAGGVEPSRIAVLDGAGAPELLTIFDAADELEAEMIESRDEALHQVRKGAVDGLVQPGAPPRLLFDPQRPEAATARLRVERALARALDPDAEPVLELEPRAEPGSRYVDFLFPGLIGMNLMGTGMWGVGFAIADIRRRKFLRRLLVTPMRRSSFISSFMLSRLVFLVLELAFLAGFGAWILGIPFRGNLISFFLISLLGALVFAAMGILVTSRAKTIEAASGLMNFVMLPMWLFSGVFFSYERFPDAVHPLLRVLPLTALNDALRAIMLDGESIFAQGIEVAIMTAWCIVCFVVAVKIFRWE